MASRPNGRGGRPGSRGQAPRGRQGGTRQGKGAPSRPGRGSRPQGRRQDAGRPQSPRRGGVSRPTGDVVEGRRACAEALETGVPIKRALISPGPDADQALSSLVRRLDEAGVPIERVPRARLDSLSSHGAHQGIVLQTKPFEYAELDEVIANAGSGDALVLVLDHVTDEGNFGAIVRSAEVVGAAGVVIPKARSARVGTAAYKTSAGAVLHLPIAQVPNLATALDRLRKAGFWAAAASEHADQDVWDAPLSGRLALVMGSEGSGVSRLVMEHCDFSCRLPQRGSVESLNVAQAATVLSYEWLRRVTRGEGADA